MKKGIVKYSKEYVSPIGLKEWLGIELEFDMSSETALETFLVAKKEVESFRMSSEVYKDIVASGFFSEEPPIVSADRQIGVTVDDIIKCDDVKVLQSYKFIVRKDDALREAYQKREKELMESLNDNK